MPPGKRIAILDSMPTVLYNRGNAALITACVAHIAENLRDYCPHPPARLYSWTAYDGTICVGCCDCGAILAGALPPVLEMEP